MNIAYLIFIWVTAIVIYKIIVKWISLLISQPLHWVSFVVEHFQKLSLSYQSFQKTISVGIIALYLFAIANATSQLEHENVPGVVESLKVVTEKNTERLCRFAFDYARENGRKKVTVVHKAVR